MRTVPTPVLTGDPAADGVATDRVGLSWLVTVRWTSLIAVAGAVMAGLTGLQAAVPVELVSVSAGLIAASNVWLMWRIRTDRAAQSMRLAGVFVCADVVMLTGLLLRAGGALNPASAFYLVQIVMTALVLGRTWTAIVTALSVAGYTTLFVTPTSGLSAAQLMHPEIGLHMRGMWVAFALTSLIVGVLVTRLAIAVERRDQALALLRDHAARATRFAGLTTLATGAAHELSTPLATMAVAAHEMERALEGTATGGIKADLALIREEIARCRRILDDMTGRSGEPSGQAPRPSSLTDVQRAIESRLTPAEVTRVRTLLDRDTAVVWPVDVVARAIVNLVRNGLQASGDSQGVSVDVAHVDTGHVRIAVVDRGSGMSADHLARAGEPFFTTKPPGMGTGLGLFVTRSSVKQLGGTLTMASEPGRGTTATVLLPVDVVTKAHAT